MKNFLDFIKEELVKIGNSLGSNDGGLYSNSNGEKIYVKKYDNPEQAKVEDLTGKIYNHMGIKTQNAKHNSGFIESKWNDDLKHVNSNFYNNINERQANQLGKMYHAAILTKNWDIVGLEHENIMLNHKTGDLHSIDHGGSFHFRAQGGDKHYGNDIDEKKSLLNNNYTSGNTFNKVFKKYPNALKHGLDSVKNIDDNHIHKLFKDSGLSNWEILKNNFLARKRKLLSD